MDHLTEAIYLLHAQILKALANPRRLMILDLLQAGEQSVNDLETALVLPHVNVAQHLAALRAEGLVRVRRDGSTVYYSLVSNRIAEACDLFHQFLSERMHADPVPVDPTPPTPDPEESPVFAARD